MRIDVDDAPWNPDWTTIPSSDTQTTSYTIDDLTNGTEYTFEVRAVNAVGEGDADSTTATPVQPNQPPTLDGPTTVSFAENSTDAVATYTAADSDGDSLTWSLTGTDASAFELQGSGTTRTLHFQSAPDFETQQTYTVDVVVNDGSLSATVAVTVSVSNVDEPGTIELSSTQPRVGEPITAILTDPDGSVTNVRWTWLSFNPDGTSSEETGTSAGLSSTFTPTQVLLGKRLQATAEYDDRLGTDQSAESAQTEAVIDRPDSPGSLVATLGHEQITLSWTAPDDNGSPITHYEYRLSDDGGPTWSPDWTTIPDSDAQTTSYTVESLTNGTEYTFEVRAVNAAGRGTAAQVSATPRPRPDAVANLEATPDNEQVVLRWEAPPSDGEAEITGYQYRYGSTSHDSWTDSEPAWADVSSGAAARNQTVSSLTNGTEYTFEVRAVNSDIEGTAAHVSATPATMPEAVVNLAATPDNEQVVLRWEAPASNGGSAIIGYEYRYSSDSHDTWTESDPAWADVSDGAAAQSQTVSSLTNGTEYTFEVRAVNSVGEGPASNTSATPATVPEAVVNLAATPGNEQVVLRWEAPASNGGSAITGYEYRYSSDSHDTWTESDPAWADVSDGAAAQSQTVSSLTNGTEYTFEVRAINAAGKGPATSVSATPAVSKPGPVRNLSASPGDRSVTLRWEAPASDGGSPITHYQYLRSGGSWTTVSGGASARSKTVPSLTNGTTYTLYVRAVNSVGGGSSTSITATPVEPEPVCIPSLSLSATPGNRGVILRWSANSCDEIIDHYEYSYSRGSFTTKGTSKGIYDLKNCKSESFTVSAINAGGSIIATDSESATPEGSLGKPLLSITSQGNTYVSLWWSTPTNNTCRDLTLKNYTVGSYSGTSNNTTISKLTHCNSYSFSVTATYTDGTKTTSGSRLVTLERPGTVSLTPQEPLQGFPLTAALADPDGEISGKSWSFNGEPTSRAVYIPTELGESVSVSVSYTDACGTGNSASATSDPVVSPSAKPVGLQAMPDSVLAAVAGPNPFNPATTIYVQLPDSSPVSLIIYNITGQLVRTLLDGHLLKAGYHAVAWDGRDQQGYPVTSGVYLYQLRTSKQVLMNKMVLIR